MYIYKRYNFDVNYETIREIFNYPPWIICDNKSDDEIIKSFMITYPNVNCNSIIAIDFLDVNKLREYSVLVYPFILNRDIEKLKPLEKLVKLKMFY